MEELSMGIIPDNSFSNGDSRQPYRLVQKIVALSNSKNWFQAKDEWELQSVWLQPGGICLCGHAPITEHCLICNSFNGNTAVVGNVCVEQFIGLASDRLFTVLRRISADIGATLNAETIEHAYREGWLNSWEAKFYRNTGGRRKLTRRQIAKRVEVNQAVLAHCRREASYADRC
jgi:hypothetical protein